MERIFGARLSKSGGTPSDGPFTSLPHLDRPFNPSQISLPSDQNHGALHLPPPNHPLSHPQNNHLRIISSLFDPLMKLSAQRSNLSPNNWALSRPFLVLRLSSWKHCGWPGAMVDRAVLDGSPAAAAAEDKAGKKPGRKRKKTLLGEKMSSEEKEALASNFRPEVDSSLVYMKEFVGGRVGLVPVVLCV